jgi:hypothetical protein
MALPNAANLEREYRCPAEIRPAPYVSFLSDIESPERETFLSSEEARKMLRRRKSRRLQPDKVPRVFHPRDKFGVGATKAAT